MGCRVCYTREAFDHYRDANRETLQADIDVRMERFYTALRTHDLSKKYGTGLNPVSRAQQAISRLEAIYADKLRFAIYRLHPELEPDADDHTGGQRV